MALLGILVATASIGFEDRLPTVSVGIDLQVPDILLLASLGWVAIRWIASPELRIVRTPLDRPLLTFFAVTLFSTIVALIQSAVEYDQAISRIRVFSYYLTFFVVTNLVRERRQLTFLLNGLFVLATVVAAAMIAQYALGDSVHLVVRNQYGAMPDQSGFEASARIAPPGLTVVLVAFMTTLCMLVVDTFRSAALLRAMQCGFLGIASLVSFLRSYWAGILVAILLLGLLVRGRDRRRLIWWGLWTTAVICTTALILQTLAVNPNESGLARMVNASWARYSTLGRSGTFEGEDDNVEFRKLEYGYAVSAVASSPIIGLGMGAAYRPFDPRLDGRDADGVQHDLRRLIHNGHMMILVQSGLLGYLSLLWLSLAFLVRGLRHWRKLPTGEMRGVVLGFTLIYVAVCIAAVGNSAFMQWSWTSVLGTIMAVNEVLLRTLGPGHAMASQ